MIEAVIFDMDGLLIDSEPFWDRADEAMLDKRGIKYSEDFKKGIMGAGQKEYIDYLKKEFGLEGDFEKLVSERRDTLYAFMKKDLTLMPGGEDFIKSLYPRYKIAAATGGHKKEKALEILTDLGVGKFFSIIVSSDDVTRGKPNPDIFLETARQLDISPEDCLVVEDAPNGVMAGKAAGMTVYGINKDGGIRERLKEAGADKVFKSLVEVDELSPTRS